MGGGGRLFFVWIFLGGRWEVVFCLDFFVFFPFVFFLCLVPNVACVRLWNAQILIAPSVFSNAYSLKLYNYMPIETMITTVNIAEPHQWCNGRCTSDAVERWFQLATVESNQR